ncbi:hypothetical protein AB4Z54_22670, partial [Streptomyces sp. MCAF7]
MRVEPTYSGDDVMFNAGPDGWRLWVTTGPDDRDYRNRRPWVWEEAARVHGWDLGRPYVDERGEGFWLERTTRVPAWGCSITTRTWPSFARHGFRVNKTRVALLHHHGECAHGEELL